MKNYKVTVQLGRIDVEGRQVTLSVRANDETEAANVASVKSIPEFEKIHGTNNPILNKTRNIITIEKEGENGKSKA